MYGINEKVYNNLQNYFSSDENIKRVILFGSRAKGNESYNSDIDLCIDCPKKHRDDVMDKIDEIIGIYSSDILFFDSLNPEIRKQIETYGIDLYNN